MFQHNDFFYSMFRVKEELFVSEYIPFGIFIEIISIIFRLCDLEPHHLNAGVFFFKWKWKLFPETYV